ncbi:hypothetical protein Tco_0351384 [Tanacetum coccineum]
MPDRLLLKLEDQINYLKRGAKTVPKASSMHVPQSYANVVSSTPRPQNPSQPPWNTPFSFQRVYPESQPKELESSFEARMISFADYSFGEMSLTEHGLLERLDEAHSLERLDEAHSLKRLTEAHLLKRFVFFDHPNVDDLDGGYLELALSSLMWIQRISLIGFPAQSVGSSNTDVLDSPCLLVLITGTSQSRQHESCMSPTAELFEVDSGRISNRHCEY